MPALEITDLRIRIRDAPLVRGLTLSLQPGQRMALLGASGSGKSLTAAAVIGQLPPVAAATGSVQVQGQEVLHLPTLRRPVAARVAMVFQDSSAALNPMCSIGRQLRESFVRQGFSVRKANASAAQALRDVGLPDPERMLRRHPGALSGGQRQRICLALALACHTSMLVADEPTTALDVITQAAVIDLIRSHNGAAGGPALLFITHDIAVAAQLCDEIAVLDRGELVERGPAKRVVHHPETRATADRCRGRRTGGPGRRVRIGQVNPAADAACPGDTGCRCGVLLGKSGRPGRTAGLRWFRRQVQYIPQDPASSLDPRRRVESLVAEPLRRLGFPGDHQQRVRTVLDAVGLGPEFSRRRPTELSGGQCQRVAMARAIAPGPRILVADEPVSGLDLPLREQIIGMLNELSAALGLAILIVSHDLSVVAQLCERCAVMNDGRIVEDRPSADVLQSPDHSYTRLLIDSVPRLITA